MPSFSDRTLQELIEEQRNSDSSHFELQTHLLLKIYETLKAIETEITRMGEQV